LAYTPWNLLSSLSGLDASFAAHPDGLSSAFLDLNPEPQNNHYVQDAHTAFQAVSAAAKQLQDTGKRAALDEAREDRELRAMAEAEAAQQERARQWRVVKGEEPACEWCFVEAYACCREIESMCSSWIGAGASM